MDILNLVQSGANVQLSVSAYELTQFAENLIKRTMDEQRIIMVAQAEQQTRQEKDGDSYLTVQEAAKMCNVCPTTLYAWKKNGYLVPCKIGRSNRYALSDIQKLLSNHGVDESKQRKGAQPMNRAQQEIARKAANAGL